ncbi:MAG TPA: 5'-methylthioadenosine/adenosylhomocysteine nucleosidase [Nitratifractor sp.]|nr:5'-methylthioadenosine/adenosylhomocysteine nucleosidase [Nitratifractor sp.]
MMRIAILGAMPEEIEPLLEKLDDITRIDYADNRYFKAKYKGVELVIAYSKIGCAFSTLTATVLIEHFGCNMLLFSGVAGAISSELKIGDLIYADKLCKHDLDITVFGHPHGFVPEGQIYIYPDNDLISIAQKVAKEKNITLKEGTIATGDQFVSSSEKKEWIKDTFNADALEMEGYSVALVCDALNTPFFILRAISDSADGDAGVDFDTFMEKSAKVSADFILNMVDELS